MKGEFSPICWFLVERLGTGRKLLASTFFCPGLPYSTLACFYNAFFVRSWSSVQAETLEEDDLSESEQSSTSIISSS